VISGKQRSRFVSVYMREPRAISYFSAELRASAPVSNGTRDALRPCTARTAAYARRLSVEHAISHTKKSHNATRMRADGVRLVKRNEQAAYLEYCVPFEYCEFAL
jgi:predicted small metal-binding protein